MADKGSSPFDTNDGTGFSDEKSSSPCGRGRGEGLPEHIRQLFPSEFEHTEELGWIPKGWRTETFGHLLSDTIGGDWGKENPTVKLQTEHRCTIIR